VVSGGRNAQAKVGSRSVRRWPGRAGWVLTLLLVVAGARPAAANNPVTEWTLLADNYRKGAANWHTLAIMHMAMHDALNAALPVYARWFPPTPDEPKLYDAIPQAAMAAARRVLLELHPFFRFETERLYSRALARLPDSQERADGVRLGDAVGLAATRRRENDRFNDVYLFPTSTQPGKWRTTPPEYENSYTTRTRPFLFSSRTAVPSRPPPQPGSDLYLRQVTETRQIGAASSPDRTPSQSAAAFFWAYQSSQRGFMRAGIDLVARYPGAGGISRTREPFRNSPWRSPTRRWWSGSTRSAISLGGRSPSSGLAASGSLPTLIGCR